MMSARQHIGRQSVALAGAEYADGASPFDVKSRLPAGARPGERCRASPLPRHPPNLI